MHVDTMTESKALENDHEPATAEPSNEWVTPDFVEESTCAEICAYVFTA